MIKSIESPIVLTFILTIAIYRLYTFSTTINNPYSLESQKRFSSVIVR